jgi:hypothetical protein
METTFGKLECGDEFIFNMNGNLTRFIKVSNRKAKFFNSFRGKFEEIKFSVNDIVNKVA